jgi:uncharacterized protein YdcH (DUF465 family)
MKNISLVQLRKDYNYLNSKISYHVLNEDELLNEVVPKMLSGKMDLKNFILWAIKDTITYVVEDREAMNTKEDIEFIESDKRFKRILDRYDIDIEEV